MTLEGRWFEFNTGLLVIYPRLYFSVCGESNRRILALTRYEIRNSCHTGTAPVDTRYLGYSWRYAVGMQRYPYSGLLEAITECVIYNSRYVQYVPDTECLYKDPRNPF